MIPTEVSGSRFPVGSSQTSSGGWLTTARAIDTRCCSPPESSSGNEFILCARPTMFITSGTLRRIIARLSPCTFSAYATLSAALRLGSSLKSWNTQPTLRRSSGTWLCFSRERSRPPTMIRPPVGSISFSRSFTSVDLPEPDAPTTKTKSPFSITKVTPFSAATSGSYTFVTSSKVIIEPAPIGARSTSPTSAGCGSISSSVTFRTGRRDPAPRAESSEPFGGSTSVSCRVQQKCANEAVQVSVEHALGVSDLHPRARVLDLLVRVQDVAPDRVSAEAHVHAAALAGQLGLALLLRLLGEARTEDLEGGLLVRGLAALVLDRHDDVGRNVRDAHRAVGLVHVLAAGAGGAERVDADVVVVDLDGGSVLEQRRDDHLREARVAAVRLVERAETNEAMLPALGLEDPVRVLALHDERRRLDPVLLPRAGLEDLGLEPTTLGPAQVHAQQDLRPVLRVGSPGVSLDGDDRVAGVILAREERVLLQLRELLLRLVQDGEQLLLGERRGALLQEGEVALQLLVPVELALRARVLGRQLRGSLLVVPEIGFPELLSELGDTGRQRSDVKGNHGPSPAGPRSPRAALAASVRARQPCRAIVAV